MPKCNTAGAAGAPGMSMTGLRQRVELANMRSMATIRTIDAARTKALLLARLREIAAVDGTPLPSEDSAMHVANAYRAVRDPIVRLVDVEPSADLGIALARALGHLAALEIMGASYRAAAEGRRATVDAIDAISRIISANGDLRRLGQRDTPLFDVDASAAALLEHLKRAHAQMPDEVSRLATDAEIEEAMLMNVTRELSKALKATAISKLVDDRGDRDPRRAMDRVRGHLRELKKWSNGNTVIAYFPPGWQSPHGGT
jgi:hypothetical protein